VTYLPLDVLTPSDVKNDIKDYRTFPLASEANMPPKQRMAKIMNDTLMLSWKSG
jgi:hypothetical protein